jgi:hypothetical protein
MKKTLILTSLILVILSQIILPAHAAGAKSKTLPDATLQLLPAGTRIPDDLPAKITDPQLLAGWIYLYYQTTALPSWDGSGLTGKALAEYLRDQQVTVRWNTGDLGNGYSCTARVVCNWLCKLGGKVHNSNPILIDLRYQDPQKSNLARLAGSLAHETYHHMLPFGPGDDTLYEEYYAFLTGSSIAQIDQQDFTGINPLKAACLKQFFANTGRDYYNAMAAFPAVVAGLGDATDPVCR